MRVRTVLAGHALGERSVTLASTELGDPLAMVKPPVVSGSPRVGADLRVTAGEWSPAAQSATYQWLREGRAIAGATAAVYRPVAADAGKRLAVVVRVSAAGHAEASARAETASVSRAARPVWRGAKPRLTGRNKLRKKIRPALNAAAIRRVAKAPDAAVRFQWLRNGRIVRGETKRAHRLVKRDKGKRLRVRITVLRPGHEPLVILSRAVRVRDNGRKLR